MDKHVRMPGVVGGSCSEACIIISLKPDAIFAGSLGKSGFPLARTNSSLFTYLPIMSRQAAVSAQRTSTHSASYPSAILNALVKVDLFFGPHISASLYFAKGQLKAGAASVGRPRLGGERVQQMERTTRPCTRALSMVPAYRPATPTFLYLANALDEDSRVAAEQSK